MYTMVEYTTLLDSLLSLLTICIRIVRACTLAVSFSIKTAVWVGASTYTDTISHIDNGSEA